MFKKKMLSKLIAMTVMTGSLTFMPVMSVVDDIVDLPQTKSVAYAETNEDYQKQIDSYTEQININPNDAELYYKRGIAYMNFYEANNPANDYLSTKSESDISTLQTLQKNAYEDFTKAIALNPNFAEAYCARGMVYTAKSGLINELKYTILIRNSNETIDDFEKAIALKPDYSEAYYGRGMAYDMLANARVVIINSDKNEDNLRARMILRETFKRAYNDYSKAIELNPNNWQYYRKRANVSWILSKYKEVINDCNKMLELKNDDAKIYEMRGETYFHIKNYDAAIADYTNAIELYIKANVYSGTIGGAYYGRAQVYEKMKDYNNALSDYNKALEYGLILKSDLEKAQKGQKRMQKKVNKISKNK